MDFFKDCRQFGVGGKGDAGRERAGKRAQAGFGYPAGEDIMAQVVELLQHLGTVAKRLAAWLLLGVVDDLLHRQQTIDDGDARRRQNLSALHSSASCEVVREWSAAG